MRIKTIIANKILNSAGNWTVECHLELEDGRKAAASVPCGISRGKSEIAGVPANQALKQITTEIFPLLKDNDRLTQISVDQLIGGRGWGSNATLAVSVAFARASGLFASPGDQRLPKMMVLVFEGKKHGNKQLTIQEFMIIVDEIEAGVDFYQSAKEYLAANNLITTVGSEGGFSPPGITDEKILTIMKELGGTSIALDAAATDNNPPAEQLLSFIKTYPITSIEDPVPENEPEKWREFFSQARKLNPTLMVVGDDLTVTNSAKILQGAKEGLFNSVIIKPNQQGTISAAIESIKVAKEQGIKTIVSHRGQETNDSWIVDLAIKEKVDFVKFGAPCRGERVAKYNRLLSYRQKTT